MELLSATIGIPLIVTYVIIINLPVILISIHLAELSRAHDQRQFSSYFHQRVPQ